MGTVKELLATVRKQIGTTEYPPNSNNVLYNTWYYGKPVSGTAYLWCMAFVQWCFAQTGIALPLRTASCGELMRAAKSAKCWVVCDFQPGDVVIYDFSGKQKTSQHCGIVEAVLPDYGVQAIEGNISTTGSQDNGGYGFCRKSRANKYIIGAVRPVFEIEKEDDIMTGKEIYDVLQDYLAKQSAPTWAQAELEETIRLGITDGKPHVANPALSVRDYGKKGGGKVMQFSKRLISDIRALVWVVTVGGLPLAAYCVRADYAGALP